MASRLNRAHGFVFLGLYKVGPPECLRKREKEKESKKVQTCKTEILALKSRFPAVCERSANTGSLFPYLTAVTVDWGGTAAAPFVQSRSPLVPHPGPLDSLTRPLSTFEMSTLM